VDPQSPAAISDNSRQGRAAILVVADELTDDKIAEELKITRRTLARWKNEPAFRAKVQEIRDELLRRAEEAMYELSIAKKHERVAVLNDLQDKHLESLRLRAERYEPLISDQSLNADPPAEAATGLFVRKETINAAGFKSIEWTYDGSLIKSIQSLEDQAARELGQIVDKSDVSVGGSLKREYVIVFPDGAE
jgi:hypothetical protein